MAKVYLNDRVIEAADACINVFDAGLLHGMGLFETLRVYRGVPFRLSQHLDRLLHSAEKLSLLLRHDRAAITEAASELVRESGHADGRMRITVTRGPIDAEDQPDAIRSTLLITLGAAAGFAPEVYANGISAAIAAMRVNPADLMAGHKTLAYWPRLLTLQAARLKGAGEAIWFTLDGRLAEGCISNVFLAKDGNLITPPVDTPILPGVTRAAVLEVAAADGIEVEQRAVAHAELLAADEVFITGSNTEVMPVVLIERKPVGDGKPGPITRAVHQLYRALVNREIPA